MTKDDILRMAREAGIHVFPEFEAAFERFATQVAAAEREKYLNIMRDMIAATVAAEREACAKVCDDIRHPWGYSAETPDWARGTEHCAEAIRARSDT